METIHDTTKRYISSSEVSCFYERGQEEYFSSYILGVRTPPSRPMMLGSIVHKMLAEPNFDWKSDLKKNGFTSDFERIVSKISSVTPRFDHHELSLFVDTPHGFALYAGVDAVEGSKDKPARGIEYKTGKALWDKIRVDENEQITHYIYSIYKQTKDIIPFKLISMSTANGKIKEFDTFRTKEQLDNWEKKLLQFKKDLDALGWFYKKARFKDRVTI